MGPKTFNRIIDHIFPKRKEYWGLYGDMFDYPDYAGLPKKISNTLSPEAVDAMQEVLGEHFTKRRDFARAYRATLIDLGERGAKNIVATAAQRHKD
jgi:hypothetical protein